MLFGGVETKWGEIVCWYVGMPVSPFLVRPSCPFASSGSRLPWGGRWLPRGPEPASLGSRHFLPSRAEPSRAELSRAEPSRAEPSRAEPSRAEPSRAEPSRAVSPKAETGGRRPEPYRRRRKTEAEGRSRIAEGGNRRPKAEAVSPKAEIRTCRNPVFGSLQDLFYYFSNEIWSYRAQKMCV
jgi:hypothetical protein